MNMLKHCLNWKVIAGLVVVGLGVALVAPHALGAALPLLLLAACPLSMLLMMGAMGGMKMGGAKDRDAAPESNEGVAAAGGEHLSDLKGRLVRMQRDQETLAQAIADLERSETVAAGVPRGDTRR